MSIKVILFICSVVLLVFIVLCINERIRINKRNISKIKTNTADGLSDEYIESWKDILFRKDMDEKINYLITYHYIKNFPYHKNYFNIIFDGEPNDISNIDADMIISTKKYPNNK